MAIKLMVRLTMMLVFLMSFFVTAYATPFRLLTEYDSDISGGMNEIHIGTFDTFNDLIINSAASDQFSGIDLADGFSIGGLVYDGKYRLLAEYDSDISGGMNEIHIGTFDTFDDLIINSAASDRFSAIDLADGYSVGGFAFDGKYRLLTEYDSDIGGGMNEIHIGTFDTFDDLIINSAASDHFSAIDLADGFSIGGLAYDGKYQLLAEYDSDISGGMNEIHIGTFDTFNDLIINSAVSDRFSAIDLADGYSVGGLAAEWESQGVPEPATFVLFGVGLMVIAGANRKQIA